MAFPTIAQFGAAAQNVGDTMVFSLGRDAKNAVKLNGRAWIRLGKRPDGFKSQNLAVRQALINSILHATGETSVARLPSHLKNVLKIENFGLDENNRVTSQKPLTARRIRAIVREVNIVVLRNQKFADKLGVSIDQKTAESLVKSMHGGAVFQPDSHLSDCANLLQLLRTGDPTGMEPLVKDAAEALLRLPKERRLDALAAIFAGKINLAQQLSSVRMLDELRGIQSKGPLTSETLEEWAKRKLAAFNKEFPHAPPFTSDGQWDLKEILLENALAVNNVIALAKANRLDLISDGTDPSHGIFWAWKHGKGKENVEGKEAPGSVVKAFGNVEFIMLNAMMQNCDAERAVLEVGKDFKDRGLTLRSLPPGYQPLWSEFVPDAPQRVAVDLPRTHIRARFSSADGSARSIDTGTTSSEDANVKADWIRREINLFMGLSADAPETPQTKAMMIMFSQSSMLVINFMSDIGAGFEHSPRDLTFVRDGTDVLVRAKSPDRDRAPAFDFTIRIRPDGSSAFTFLDVRKGSEAHLRPTFEDRLAHGLVMSILNAENPKRMSALENQLNRSYTELMEEARERIKGDPVFVDLMKRVIPPSDDQLKVFAENAAKRMKDKIAKDRSHSHNGFSIKGLESLKTDALKRIRLKGEYLQTNDNLTKEVTDGALSRIRDLIPAGANHDKILFSLTYLMGLQGPVGELKEHPDELSLPKSEEWRNPTANQPLLCQETMGYAFPYQDLSIKDGAVVLTQKICYRPHGFLLQPDLDSFDREDSMPSVPLVCEVRIPLKPDISEGGMPDFKFTVRRDE